MQAEVKERLKTLKTYRRGRGAPRAQRVWCKRPFPEKKIKNEIKKIKISKIENEKFFKQDFCFTCAYTRVRVKNTGKCVIFPESDAVKRQEMPNLSLFSVSDGFKLKNGIVIGCRQNKRSGGL